MILTIVYELEKKLLDKSIDFLKAALNIDQLKLLCVDELQLAKIDTSGFLYTFHLDLNTEMQKHQAISHWALKNHVKELNHYDVFFDDKYNFYQFLLANGINTPKTELLSSKNTILENLVIKARHGTEKKDFACLEHLDLQNSDLLKIKAYDDVLLQEKIDIAKEYKYLYLNGELFAQQVNSQRVTDFAKNISGKISFQKKQKIFSIDIIEDKAGEVFCLEANLRPGALYQFQA